MIPSVEGTRSGTWSLRDKPGRARRPKRGAGAAAPDWGTGGCAPGFSSFISRRPKGGYNGVTGALPLSHQLLLSFS
ncbi:hypothetical protein KDH_64170 [Dictyobacter sp. S3.2.2.5]|uniref:Uncharacterized protein n=1 Tax=Dictyobacter halimunensis TaxID=3026934 RepID=A0ABQ6G159_9CHLR|nr:hypothetical protein KDH_64170 [Dictyobacter sp. S3.2.2.5]